MLHRQRKALGNQHISERIGRYFAMPAASNTTERFEQFIYLSQLTQAACVVCGRCPGPGPFLLLLIDCTLRFESHAPRF